MNLDSKILPATYLRCLTNLTIEDLQPEILRYGNGASGDIFLQKLPEYNCHSPTSKIESTIYELPSTAYP